jgi:hypothetical protein
MQAQRPAQKGQPSGGGFVLHGGKKEAGYNGRLFSVSLAGWPCRVSQRWKNSVGELVIKQSGPPHHPKDKSWS